MGNSPVHEEVNRASSSSATNITVISQSSPGCVTSAITVTPPCRGLVWKKAFKDDQDGVSDTAKDLHCLWIVYAMGATLFLMSIIPIMLLVVLAHPATGLPAVIKTSSGNFARSIQFEAQSWAYETLCEPRKGQCQLGTHASKNSNTVELSWFDPECRKVAYNGEAPKEQIVILVSNDTSSTTQPLLTKFQDPGNFLEPPILTYGDRAYSKYNNEVGGWFGPGLGGEFFSLLWFDC